MKIKTRYELNKNANVGDNCICPSCGTLFEKTNYQQAFCKTKNGTKCKDKYWNTVTPEKRNNTTRISPANARYMAKISTFGNSIRPSNFRAVGKYQGRTSEGYRIFNGIAFDEYDNEVYCVSEPDDLSWDSHK